MRSILTLALAATALAGAAHAQEIKRTYASPTAFLASSVSVPAGSEVVYLSGVIPPPEALKGDTNAQAVATLDRIEAQLKTLGLTFGDVVRMTVYLAGDPAKGGKMDFEGWNAAYKARFGTPTQPNRPARSTVQVAALALPGALLEVEVQAARNPPAKK